MREWIELGRRERLTVRELSERSGEQPRTLHRWAARLRGEPSPASPLPPPADEGRGAFVELVERAAAPTGRIEILPGGERRIVVSGEVDEAALARVVRAFERC